MNDEHCKMRNSDDLLAVKKIPEKFSRQIKSKINLKIITKKQWKFKKYFKPKNQRILVNTGLMEIFSVKFKGGL